MAKASSIFTDPNPKIFEQNINWGEAMKKYFDKYMIVTNSHVEEDGYLFGDIIALLAPDEYYELELPKPFLPKYEVWVGSDLKAEGFGVHGF